MGASADEIDSEMNPPREHIAGNLGVLEQRVTREQVRRYARIAAIVLGTAAVAGAGVLMYRRMHGRTRREQMKDTLLEGLRDLPDSLRRISPGRWVMRRVG